MKNIEFNNDKFRVLKISYLSVLIMVLGAISPCYANESIIDEEFFELHIDDCNGMAELCLDIPFGESSNYDFLVNGSAYSGMVQACNFDTIYNYGYADVPMPGPYFLDSWFVNNNNFSGEFPDMFALLDSMNVWDPTGNWEINTMAQLIIGGNPGTEYSQMFITMLLLNSPTILDVNIGTQPTGSQYTFETGLHEVVIFEQATGCLDTIQVAVSCAQPDEVWVDLLVSNADTVCFDFSELPGFVQNISNIHAVDADPVADYSFINGNSCLEVLALSNGLDTACIVYCDQLDFCDTTFVYVSVTDGLQHTIDTTYTEIVVYSTSSFCFFDEFNGNSVSAVMGCDGASSDIVFSSLDANNCIEYTANGLEQDQICVIFTDNAGNTHTEYLIVTVIPPTPEVIQETVLLSTIYTDCLDVSELNGNIVNIEDICALNSNDAVNFGTNNVSLCIEAEAASIGVDTACIVICDDQNVCDTTTYIITVVENIQTPILVDDFLSSTPNNQINLDLCDNDQLSGLDITSVSIVSDSSVGNGPQNGLVAINQGCSITYTPNEDYCGNDSFDYVVCNANGCDTATVDVVIDCNNSNSDDLEIKNGFSPNFDGFNESFTIQGINNYPGNILRVYNRWGVRVFETRDYQNDWRGTWIDGDLPDGTYFYVLDLSEDGNVRSGYVQINR